MIEVTVSRYPADKQGEDIVDPLITSEAGANVRGQAEIDANGYNMMITQVTGPLQDAQIDYAPGTITEVLDDEQEAWRGTTERTALVIERTENTFTATMAADIERLAEDS